MTTTKRATKSPPEKEVRAHLSLSESDLSYLLAYVPRKSLMGARLLAAQIRLEEARSAAMTIKSQCFDVMEQAYDEASDGGRLPVPGRQMYYAVRRASGLGDELGDHYFLNGSGEKKPGLLDQYINEHPDETADWDILRDARGTFVDPHNGDEVPLGTLDVRRHLEQIEDHDTTLRGIRFSLDYPKRGPGDSFGAILYLEKEGFREVLAADGLQQRYDLAVCSSKGYGNRATKALLEALQSEYDVPVFVAHDLDKNGIGIGDVLDDALPHGVYDLGLRWHDVQDPRWGLQTMTESVTYTTRGKPYDPRPNLIERGADPDEVAFLCSTAIPGGEFSGHRVELNALIGGLFIQWLESKLVAQGVTKLVPEQDVLEDAYRRTYELARINEMIAAALPAIHAEALAIELPDDLDTWVSERLTKKPRRTWDRVIAGLVVERVYDA